MGNYLKKKRPANHYKHTRELVQEVDNQYFNAMSALAGSNRITVYVEGYQDIAFWRNIFDQYTTETRKFQIMTPNRDDLAKGKKVVLSFAEKAGPNLLLCVDSDFDYLFPEASPQAQRVNKCPYLIQTYAYAIENLLCYPESLQSLTVKATKIDREIFDYPRFLREYSQTIYPAFVWYAWAARESQPEIFSLSDFKNTVRLNFLDITDNGAQTILWLERQVNKRISILAHKYPEAIPSLQSVEERLQTMKITPSDINFYMQGHTLLDNVVKIVLSTICETLRKTMIETLDNSRANRISQRNQISYYNNSLVELDILLADNTGYMSSSFYKLIQNRINKILEETPQNTNLKTS